MDFDILDEMGLELDDLMDSVVPAYPCGCSIEPDGRCSCGNPSILIELGMI